jgi:hypothetical protein
MKLNHQKNLKELDNSLTLFNTKSPKRKQLKALKVKLNKSKIQMKR